MYQRHIEAELKAALADTPVVLLNGARQTGKSTLAQKMVKALSGRYLTLDDVTVLAAAASDPKGFIDGLKGMVVIDEVQKAPALFPTIKADVDRDRRPGRFLLTGSAHVLLLPRLAESLAGRMEVLTLWPLSQGEFLGRKESFIDGVFSSILPKLAKTRPEDDRLLAKIIAGGYPDVAARKTESRRQAWFASYITAILQRDIRDLSQIEGLTEMPRLLSLLAARVSGLLNLSELSRASGIPQTTLNRYMSLLQTTFLLQTVSAWSGNLGKRLIKSPKIHLLDSGLVSHLVGQTEKRLSKEPLQSGYLLETFVVMELRKQMSWSKIRVSLFHFRSVTGQEVDIVLEDAQGRTVGIEVKMAKSVQKKDFQGLRALSEAMGQNFFRGIVLYNGEEAVSFGERFEALPVSALWRLGVS